MNAEQTCKIIDALKFDFVEITGGHPEGTHQTIRKGNDEYYYKDIVQTLAAKKLLEKQPVIVTGGFQGITDGEAALKDGVAAVGYCRKFLRNDKFILKDDSKCMHCNHCTSGFGKVQEVECAFNK